MAINDLLLTDIYHNKDLKAASDGDLQTVRGIENVKMALFHRLVTSPGSLVHRPDYGVGIKDFQNAVMSIDNQKAIAKRINEQFLRDFRVEEVTGVSITQDRQNPAVVKIFVRVKVAGFNETLLDFIPFGETS